MIIVEECIKETEKLLYSTNRYNNNYELYLSIRQHLLDYKFLLELVCKNSIDFDSYKSKDEFKERIKK